MAEAPRIKIKVKAKAKARPKTQEPVPHRPLKATDLSCIGSHVRKDGTLAKSIVVEPYHWPIQIFLNGRNNTKVSISESDIARTHKILCERPRDVYVHAAYNINLCKPTGTEGDYFTKATANSLDVALRCGFRGVVVHTGNCVKGSRNSMEDMIRNTKIALESTTVECPLLIETPVGCGTEQLVTPEAMVQFIHDVNDERLGLCIDTCHVFAAGYDPVEYWQRLHALDALKYVKLVHYNDSATKKGSHVDCHAMIGFGHIGLEKLLEFASYACSLGVPMVRE